jgi:arabinofuranosyltransferase
MTDQPLAARERIDDVVETVAFAACFYLVFVFFRIAWVTDDAYITFRAVEQLFAGNGPRWNPHERVQAFTSPLWLWYLAAFRLFSHNVFISAIIASALAFFPSFFLIRAMLRDSGKWLLALLLLLASVGFFDYTTSGLENPLAYCLICVYLLVGKRLLEGPPQGRPSAALVVTLCFGLLLTCRHDLFTLFAPATAYSVWRYRRAIPAWRLAGAVVLGLSPILLWTLFSLVYYGAPFPNPAYAKLTSGLAGTALITQGAKYFLAGLQWDTVTGAVIVLGTVVILWKGNAWSRWLGVGVILNVFYVVAVGGDFMLGRFFAFSFLVVVVTALDRLQGPARFRRMGLLTACGVLLVYVAAHPLSAARGERVKKKRMPFVAGIADERGAYWRNSLVAYLSDPQERSQVHVFPDHPWAVRGYNLARRPVRYAERDNVGMLGYFAGPRKIIVDRLALTDPLLARLPMDPCEHWRPGHYRRMVPMGYSASVIYETTEIVDHGINEYYKRIRLITQSQTLLSRERLHTVVLMNLGHYEHYLDGLRQRYRSKPCR